MLQLPVLVLYFFASRISCWPCYCSRFHLFCIISLYALQFAPSFVTVTVSCQQQKIRHSVSVWWHCKYMIVQWIEFSYVVACCTQSSWQTIYHAIVCVLCYVPDCTHPPNLLIAVWWNVGSSCIVQVVYNHWTRLVDWKSLLCSLMRPHSAVGLDMIHFSLHKPGLTIPSAWSK